MRLTANGKQLEIATGTSILELLGQLGMDAERVAVEHNRGIVSRERFATALLAEGDQLEIVQFVGGG